MSYYYHDSKDDYKKKVYEDAPLFVVRLSSDGESRNVFTSADKAKQFLSSVLENPPVNLSMVTYGIETPGGDRLFIE